MNKQEILNLKAGEELDELIDEMVLSGFQDSEDDGTSTPPRKYSSDSSVMWDIINIFVNNNFKYTITNNSEYEHSCIFDSIDSHKRYIAHCNNLPEAVCKAALMAAFGEKQHRNKTQ